MERPALFLNRLGMYCFAPIGVLLLLVTSALVASTTAWLARTVETQGTVIELLRFEDSDRTGYVYAPVVRFATAEGKAIEFQSHTRTYPPAYRKGETITVVYDPEEPQSASIRSFIALWFGSLIAGFIGGIFFLIGAAMALGGWYADRALQQSTASV